MFTPFEELPRRSSELKKCFYCGNPLPANSGEHIFNSSWGGSYKTRELICHLCNSTFSGQIDTAFTVYVQAVMNSWSFKGERHQEVPKIILENEYFLDQGAKLKLKQPLVKDEILSNGRIKSNLIFNSKSEAKRWIISGGMAEWLGKAPSTEEQECLRKIIIETTLNTTEAKPQPASVQLNLREQYRSSAHTILKCLGLFLPEWVCADSTKQIRDFVRYDQGDWRFFAVHSTQLFSIAEQVSSFLGLGVHHNSVEIYWDSSTKMVVGVLSILNRVKRSVVISQNYSGADAILYVVEDTYSSKKPPKAVFTEFDSTQLTVPVPLINFQYFSSPYKIYEYFEYEVQGLMGLYYPVDVITARLIKGIETINKKNLNVDQTTLEEYLNLFLSFFSDLSTVRGTSVDLDKASSKLFEYGFAILVNRHSGKLYTDPEVQFLMGAAFDQTLRSLNI